MAIRGVLFDKDGTLIEMDGLWVPVIKGMVAEEFGAGPAEVAAMLAPVGYDAASDTFLAGSVLAAGTTQQLVEVLWPHLDAAAVQIKSQVIGDGLVEKSTALVTALMPLHDVFDELHALGMRLGIATNDSEGSALSHVAHLGIEHYFVDVIGFDSVDVPKPSGQMIARFAEKTDLKPSEIAMVGDNTHDLEEARNGGAGLAIGVLSGNGTHDDIAHLADHVLNSVAELPALLRKLA
jgi:phosphoglycolate phosphatase